MDAVEDPWLDPFGDEDINHHNVPLDDMGDPPMEVDQDHLEELETPVAVYIPTEPPPLILANAVTKEYLYFRGWKYVLDKYHNNTRYLRCSHPDCKVPARYNYAREEFFLSRAHVLHHPDHLALRQDELHRSILQRRATERSTSRKIFDEQCNR